MPAAAAAAAHRAPAVPAAQELWRGRVEQVSWKPRAFVYHNFLTDEECEHLKALARLRLTKSTVVDNQSGKSVDSRVRTSSGMFLARGEDEVVKRIEKRIALVTMIPEGVLRGWWVGWGVGVRSAGQRQACAGVPSRAPCAPRCAAMPCRERRGNSDPQVCGQPEVRAPHRLLP